MAGEDKQNVEPKNGEVMPAGQRYLSSDLSGTFDNVLIQLGGIGGAALAVMNSDKIASSIGFGDSSMLFLVAFGVCGYLVGNLVAQIVLLLFNDLMQPFVPNSWTN